MRALALQLVVVASLSACSESFEGDIVVPAQAKGHAGAIAVNGRIRVGEGAEVVGALRTVNGRVEVAANSHTGALATVNGSVDIGDEVVSGSIAAVNGDVKVGMQARIGGGLGTVNGGIHIGGGSVVEGDVATVNGAIELRGVTVRGQVENRNGDLRLLDGTLVEGDVWLRDPDSAQSETNVVVVGVGVQVRGVLRAERPVRLFVHPSARLARVEGVEPETLEGTDVASH